MQIFSIKLNLLYCVVGTEIQKFYFLAETYSKCSFKLLDEFCPENTPSTVTVSNNSATVVFRRPPSFTGTGFLISYIAIVPNELIDGKLTLFWFSRTAIDVDLPVLLLLRHV